MKIEKITENKIRITLKREEFKDKKIDINELLLTRADSQKLFLEILNQAEKSHTPPSSPVLPLPSTKPLSLLTGYPAR